MLKAGLEVFAGHVRHGHLEKAFRDMVSTPTGSLLLALSRDRLHSTQIFKEYINRDVNSGEAPELGDVANLFGDKTKAVVLGLTGVGVGLAELSPFLLTLIGIATNNLGLALTPWAAKAGLEYMRKVFIDVATQQPEILEQHSR